MLVTSPTVIMNGPIMLFGSCPFLKMYIVAKRVRGVKIKFDNIPAKKGIKIISGVRLPIIK